MVAFPTTTLQALQVTPSQRQSFQYTAFGAQNGKNAEVTNAELFAQLAKFSTDEFAKNRISASLGAKQLAERTNDLNKALLTNNQQGPNPLANLGAPKVDSLNAALGNLDRGKDGDIVIDDALRNIQQYEKNARAAAKQQQVDTSLFDRNNAGNNKKVSADRLNQALLANNGVQINQLQQPGTDKAVKSVDAKQLRPDQQTDTSKLAMQNYRDMSAMLLSKGLAPYAPANMMNGASEGLNKGGAARSDNNALHAETNADGGGDNGMPYMQLGAQTGGEQPSGQQDPRQPFKQGLTLVA